MEVVREGLKSCNIKLIIFIVFTVFLVLLSICDVNAESEMSFDEIYQREYKASGADELEKKLPKEAKSSLERLDIRVSNINSITDLTPSKIFKEFVIILKQQSPIPLKSVGTALSIIILCAVVEGMKISFGEKPLSGIVGVISSLCICMSIIMPIVDIINNASMIIKYSANFMLAYIPVMAGIMVASGQPISAASYHMMMVSAGEVISQIASKFLVPFLNVFLSLSVVSSLSNKMNLSGICKMINTVVKWILSFVMTTFVSLLTLQSVVTNTSDNTGVRTIKFAINSFVPIVGGALSDAYTTVQGCIKVLKSGVGAFGVLAAGIIFIPVILQCVIWLFSINLCASIGDIFELNQITVLLRSVAKVVSTMLAIILCCMTILTISTVLILIIGGGVT